MTEGEIARLFPDGPSCIFTYTSDSPAVLAIGPVDEGTAGLVKLGGDLVRVEVPSGDDIAAGVALQDEGISIQVSAPGGGSLSGSPNGAWQEADMTLELDAGLTAGFRGFYRCKR